MAALYLTVQRKCSPRLPSTAALKTMYTIGAIPIKRQLSIIHQKPIISDLFHQHQFCNMKYIALFIALPFLAKSQDTIPVDMYEYNVLQDEFKQAIMDEPDAMKHVDIMNKYDKKSKDAIERGRGKGLIKSKAIRRKKK